MNTKYVKEMFVDKAEKEVMHGIYDNELRRIKIRKPEVLGPANPSGAYNTITTCPRLSMSELLSSFSTFEVGSPLPGLVICVVITIFLACTVANGTKMIVGNRNKTGRLSCSRKIANDTYDSTSS
jgi:hypothetical protein